MKGAITVCPSYCAVFSDVGNMISMSEIHYNAQLQTSLFLTP